MSRMPGACLTARGVLFIVRLSARGRGTRRGTRMPDGIELSDYICPKCGETARLDARFIQWCTACGHNADPKPPDWSSREQRRHQREYERSRRLFESLRTASSLRPTSVTGVSVTLLSGV